MTTPRSILCGFLLFIISGALFCRAQQAAPAATGVARVPVVFSGGHDTDGVDRGRPVILIAHALGVTPEVFREAFSHVHPAGPDRGPTDAEARANKQALMEALEKYGVTDDRLNSVSNYYRYNRSRGEIWTNKSASAVALVKDGAVVGFEIADGGSGYSSAPAVTVAGYPTTHFVAAISFGSVLDKNGSVASIIAQK